jgi:hypothetical protein
MGGAERGEDNLLEALDMPVVERGRREVERGGRSEGNTSDWAPRFLVYWPRGMSGVDIVSRPCREGEAGGGFLSEL